MKAMRCTRCGGKDFGRLELKLSTEKGPITRIVFQCNRCGLPRGEFLSDPEFEEVALTSLLRAQLTEAKKTDGGAFGLVTGAFCYEIWKEMRKQKPGAERARRMHKDVDEAIGEYKAEHPEGARRIRCKAGCHSCCYTAVGVTLDEAELLAERVEGGLEIDRDRLDRQQGPARDDKAWFTGEISHADRRCVFLSEKGECRVYEDRPAACRKYFVGSDPEFCDFEKHPTHGVMNLVSHAAECITTAAYTIDKSVNFLPVALLAALKRRGK